MESVHPQPTVGRSARGDGHVASTWSKLPDIEEKMQEVPELTCKICDSCKGATCVFSALASALNDVIASCSKSQSQAAIDSTIEILATATQHLRDVSKTMQSTTPVVKYGSGNAWLNGPPNMQRRESHTQSSGGHPVAEVWRLPVQEALQSSHLPLSVSAKGYTVAGSVWFDQSNSRRRPVPAGIASADVAASACASALDAASSESLRARLNIRAEVPTLANWNEKQEKAGRLRQQYQAENVLKKAQQTQEKHAAVKKRTLSERDQLAAAHHQKMHDASERAEKHLNDIRNRARLSNFKVQENLFIQNLTLQNAKSELDLKLKNGDARRKRLMQQKREDTARKLRTATAPATEMVDNAGVSSPQCATSVAACSGSAFFGSWASAASAASAASQSEKSSSETEAATSPFSASLTSPVPPGEGTSSTSRIRLSDVYPSDLKEKWQAACTPQLRGMLCKRTRLSFRRLKGFAAASDNPATRHLAGLVIAAKIESADLDILRGILAIDNHADSLSAEEQYLISVLCLILAGRDDKALHRSQHGPDTGTATLALLHLSNFVQQQPKGMSILISDNLCYSVCQLLGRRLTGTESVVSVQEASICAVVLTTIIDDFVTCSTDSDSNCKLLCDAILVAVSDGIIHKIQYLFTRMCARSKNAANTNESTTAASLLQAESHLAGKLLYFLSGLLRLCESTQQQNAQTEYCKSLHNVVFAALKETEFASCIIVLMTVLLPWSTEQQLQHRKKARQNTIPYQETRFVMEGAGHLEGDDLHIVQATLELLVTVGKDVVGRALLQDVLGNSSSSLQLEFLHVLRTILKAAANLPSRIVNLTLAIIGEYSFRNRSNQATLCYGTPSLLDIMCTALPVRYYADVAARDNLWATLLAASVPSIDSTEDEHFTQPVFRVLSNVLDYSRVSEFVKSRANAGSTSMTACGTARAARNAWRADAITLIPQDLRQAHLPLTQQSPG